MLETCQRGAGNIQRLWRGLCGRRWSRRLRRAAELEHYAAARLQKIFRGRKILRWRQVRMQLTLQKARVAADTDADRAGASVVRRQMYADSASEDEEDGGGASDGEGFDWVEHFDDEKGVPFWWSASRGERKDEEPVDPHVYNKAFVGEKVKVNWPGAAEWCVKRSKA